MPTDITLFDMLEPRILRGMSDSQLIGEIERVRRMESRIAEYLETIVQILARLR